MSRVLPQGGSLDSSAKAFGAQRKVVEPPNPNRKFSRRPPSGANHSTVFDDTAPPPSPARNGRARSKSPCFDPFDHTRPDHVNNATKQGVRVTRLDIVQQEKARIKEVTPRAYRKVVDGGRGGMRTEGAAKDPIVSAFGLTSSGGKGSVGNQQVNRQTKVPDVAPPPTNYAATNRFRCSPSRSASSVLRAESLADTGPQFKNQRFAHSPSRRHDSLVGVLAKAPAVAAPPAYTLKSPWHTD
jgi:hypothetical protein